MNIVTIETPSLGDRSYVVHDDEVAIVVDPQRDLDRVEQVLADAGVRVAAVVETHIHNDYVSGGLALAERHGASYHVSAADEVEFDHVPTMPGDHVHAGSLVLRAVHTPGHTPTHLAWVLEQDGKDVAVFTGGSLLFGSVGRTDLVSESLTEKLTREQFRSAKRLAELDDDVEVLPTHGFGSFCSSGDMASREESTIGLERRENQALTQDDEEAFVEELLAGLDAYPSYYAHMAPRNRAGAEPVDLDVAPERADAAEIGRRIHAGEWVVDLRNRRAFAEGHLVGTISVEVGDSFSTHLGWVLPWGTPVTLVGTAEEVAEAQRQLVRIGIDELAGQARRDDLTDGPNGKYDVVDFAGLRKAVDHGDDVTVLDVRRELEWQDGHLDGAVHVPLHDLLDRLGDVPHGTLWVHCASGYRASIAASLLARAGHEVVLVDDDFEHASDHFDLVEG